MPALTFLAPGARAAPIVLVLAAGHGARFRASGGQVHKLQASLAGVPVLQHVLAAVAASGLPHHVVHPVMDHDSTNDDAEGGPKNGTTPGMGDSIARGVRATAGAAGWLILPGDLALVMPRTLQQVAQALATHPVAVPVWQRQRGHPVGFGPACGAALTALAGDRGAASVVAEWRGRGGVVEVPVQDAGSVADIDTVDDLAAAERLLAVRRGAGARGRGGPAAPLP